MDHELLARIGEVTKVPICVYRGMERVFQWPEESRFESIFDLDIALAPLWETAKQRQGGPFLFLEDSHIYYGTVARGEEILIVGPTVADKADFATKRDYRQKHKLKVEAWLPKASTRRLSRILSLICYCTMGEEIDPDAMRIVSVDMNKPMDLEGELENYELEVSEQERDHNSQEYERMLLKIVREGNVAAMEQILTGAHMLEDEHVGVLAQTRFKQSEYMAVALVTLISRAAVEGGMSQEKAFSLADLYMQKFEHCKTSEEILSLAARAEFDFTEKVKLAGEKASKLHYIEDCKNYIANNLRKPFQIGDIAPEIGVNRSYLARKFSEVEGMTIQQYVTRERCAHAAKLLRYSDYPISLITDYFCFSSQSHFGRAFKDYSGMTPKEYRNQYKR